MASAGSWGFSQASLTAGLRVLEIYTSLSKPLCGKPKVYQSACKKIPCGGSRKSPQLKHKPEDVDLCTSVRAGSVEEVWIVACTHCSACPRGRHSQWITAPSRWCASLKPPVGKPPQSHLGFVFRFFFQSPQVTTEPPTGTEKAGMCF